MYISMLLLSDLFCKQVGESCHLRLKVNPPLPAPQPNGRATPRKRFGVDGELDRLDAAVTAATTRCSLRGSAPSTGLRLQFRVQSLLVLLLEAGTNSC